MLLCSVEQSEGLTMTYEKREAIFSKEYLSIADLQELLGLGYQEAARTMRNIKRKNDRLGIRGKIHVQDYFDFYGIKTERYALLDEERLSGDLV